jgi:hypothetical protein
MYAVILICVMLGCRPNVSWLGLTILALAVYRILIEIKMNWMIYWCIDSYMSRCL